MKKSKIKKTTNSVAKVPVVMQMEALECGAACLTMILAYYGKWVPLDKVRHDCGVSRDGSKAGNILKAARNYGLEATGYKCEPDTLKNSGSFPCIIHWNFNHFVVLDGFSGNKAVINDPGLGRYKVSTEEFDESFTGIYLKFSPAENFKTGGKPKSIFNFAKKKLTGLGSSLIYIIIATIAVSILTAVSPVLNRVFVDRILSGSNPSWLTTFIAVCTAVFTVRVIIEILLALAMKRTGGKISVGSNMSFMWKILNLPMTFFAQRMSGDILQRKMANSSITQILVTTVAPLFLNTGMIVFYLVVMARYSLKLTAIGVFSVVANYLMSLVITNLRLNTTRAIASEDAKLFGYQVSGIQMMETIKASGAEDGFFEKWAASQAKVNEMNVKLNKTTIYLGIIPSLITTVTGILIVGIGVGMTMNGNFTLGMITAFEGLFTSFTAPATSLINAQNQIQEMRTWIERTEDVMAYPDDDITKEITSSEEEYKKLSGTIEMKDVTFGYSEIEKPLIENFSMSVKPGQKIAFVGQSGCGKSTLAKLIAGLYKQWTGTILFDGKSIDEIDRDVFRGSVAMVDQEITLFSDTISNNIKMWDNSIEDFEMILAARDAHIHDDIMEKPEGYRHTLKEGGKDFSGGQRQRLEIARVLAQDPSIIILDEATSALDAKTEYDVVKSINERGITCIIVAHRLSTIRDCDEIVVLDNGKIVERGNHESLLKLNGYYSRLVSNE